MKHLVFVYGTLRRGFHNHKLLEASEYAGLAVTQGRLYIRGLPYFKKADDGVVHGELYRVDDETLALLDRLEGYNRANPELSHYKRIEVDVDHNDHDTWYKAYIYEYNYPVDEQYLNKEGIYHG